MLHREAGHVHEVVVVVAVVHVALHPLRLQPVPPAALEAELGNIAAQLAAFGLVFVLFDYF